MEKNIDEMYIDECLLLAKKAAQKGDVPVGALIVNNGKVVAKAYNKRQNKSLATAHAEILAINKACKKLKTWHLVDCTLYVTLEPCPMCAGAIINSRIKRVVFGAFDQKGGACGSVVNLLENTKFNHNPEVVGGIKENECAILLQKFFKLRRK